MAMQFPNMPGLTDLGMVQDTAGSNVSNPVTGDLGDEAWLSGLKSRLTSAHEMMGTPAPVQGPPVASGITGLLGAIVGAIGGGGQGMAAGFQGGLAGGQEAEADIQARRMEAHNNSLKQATSYIEQRKELASGVRMILQAQPELLSGVPPAVLGEVAFPGSGFDVNPLAKHTWSQRGEGLANQAKAWEWLASHTDNSDFKAMAFKEIAAAGGVDPAKFVGWTAKEIIDQNGDYTDTALKEGFVNYAELIHAKTQGRLDIRRGVPRMELNSSAGVWKASQLKAVDNYTALKRQNPDLTSEQVWQLMQPDDQIIIRTLPNTMFGVMTLEEAATLADRSMDDLGSMGAILGGALEDPQAYTTQYRLDTINQANTLKRNNDQQTFNSMVVTRARQYKNQGMSDTEALNKARGEIKAQLEKAAQTHIIPKPTPQPEAKK